MAATKAPFTASIAARSISRGTWLSGKYGNGEAETTLRLSLANMQKMMAGDLEPTLAYMTGKLKIEGSLGVAMKISGYVSE